MVLAEVGTQKNSPQPLATFEAAVRAAFSPCTALSSCSASPLEGRVSKACVVGWVGERAARAAMDDAADICDDDDEEDDEDRNPPEEVAADDDDDDASV